MNKRQIEDESIINQVQKDYPYDSKEALHFAINLARTRERDNKASNKATKETARLMIDDEIEFLEFIVKHSLCMCDDIQTASERRLQALQKQRSEIE